MICVYSLRAIEKPTVSFPLEWKELEILDKQGDPDKMVIMHSEAVSRLENNGDLFRQVLTKKQKIPHL